ncbi:hypothetical protein F5Y14DRAFT_430003 [Nemania sp. NC0429]|nr:hypothetical protein F5Y14DRAFT_430003 [Nemania sp. NC0429]
MGIKGIYKEIGPGKRISLTKLAVQKLEESGRPLRIAIDISIWQFQAQAARGGSNPAIRTLFYRLLRLLSLSIQPILVFDGPNKPTFKRNKRSGRGDGMASAMAKRLIRLFGFLVHDAPGEAEAECALLQQNGIVDAVLSEDVDTIMFGCTRTLRNWSSEGTKGSKAPTHVSMYDTRELGEGASGLDREGMVLVALMSGGDYLPEGIPGAGVKLACEAARAGFGKSLCQLKRADTSELASWRERLTYELRHNESSFFRTRHKALTIPDDFPNMEILRYYTHPVVSPVKVLDRLRQQTWDGSIDVQGLRDFVRETFDWSYRIGAVKFIRVLAPCLLVRKLMQHGAIQHKYNAPNDANAVEKGAFELVKSIKSRRAHFSTDATPELRVSFIPTSIVGYNFEEEPDEVIDFGRDGLALNSDDEIDIADDGGDIDSTAKSGPRKPFSPTDTDLAWMPETIVRVGIPSMVEDWEEAQRAKTAARSKPKTSKPKQKSQAGGTATASLNSFVRVTKNITPQTIEAKRITRSTATLGVSSPIQPHSPPKAAPASSRANPPLLPSSPFLPKSRPTPTKPSTPKSSRARRLPKALPKADASVTPWTIASSQSTPCKAKPTLTSSSSPTKVSEPILIPSSPPSPTPKRIPPAMSRAGNSSVQDQPEPEPSRTQPVSPRKRRSLTPPETPIRRADVPSSGIARGGGIPTPAADAADRPQRKLARTRSQPADYPSPRRPQARTAGLSRAQTIAAVGVISLDSDDDSEDEHEDEDGELPPLSSLLSRIPKSGRNSQIHSTSPRLPSSLHDEPVSKLVEEEEREKAAAAAEKPMGRPQTTIGEYYSAAAEVRMTKLYVPRISQPGFFEEIDVSVDEADAVRDEYAAAAAAAAASSSSSAGGSGSGRRRVGVWRRSDVYCVDLTGED